MQIKARGELSGRAWLDYAINVIRGTAEIKGMRARGDVPERAFVLSRLSSPTVRIRDKLGTGTGMSVSPRGCMRDDVYIYILTVDGEAIGGSERSDENAEYQE